MDGNYENEEHFVVTSDDYILKVFRIFGSPNSPAAPGKIPVFLFHGLLSSAADWVIQGRGKSLAYLLADAGNLIQITKYQLFR